MYRTLAWLFLLAGPLVLIADTVALGKHGEFDIAVPLGWDCSAQGEPGVGRGITLKPKGGANAQCMITLMYLPQPTRMGKERIRQNFEKACEEIAAGSVEGKAILREFALAHGYGVYSVFTDASLAGQPASPGNYKVTAAGMVQFSDDVLAIVSLFSDDEKSPENLAMMNALVGARVVSSK
jgi:hypothetical protein